MDRRRDQARLHRRIMIGSFGVAVALHAALFLWNPAFEVEAAEGDTLWLGLGMWFGPPVVGDSTSGPARPDTAAEVSLARTPETIDLLMHWPSTYLEYNVGGSAVLSVRVDSLGRVVESAVFESSGDALKDEAFLAITSSFRYRLPPAAATRSGLDLLQRITVDELPHAVEMRRPEGRADR